MNAYQTMVDFLATLYDRANKKVPNDVKHALKKAYEKESDLHARTILKLMLKSTEIAQKHNIPICQDPGIPQFFVRVGTLFPLKIDLNKAIRDAIATVTRDLNYKSMVANSIPPHLRSRTNTGRYIPVVTFDILYRKNFIEVTVVPKGSGTEPWSSMKIFASQDILNNIKSFVLDLVIKAGAKPCPPIIVGIGVGGTSDLVMKLAKLASIRPLYQRHPFSRVRKLERELFTAINKTGIGPMGLGGDTSCLGVNIEVASTSIYWTPVAINIQCWPGRRATARLYSDGQVEYIN